MPVHIKLSTTLRDHVPGYQPSAGLHLELAGPVTAGDLALQVGLPLKDIKVVMCNGEHSSLDNLVTNNDRVAFFPAVGGG